MGFVISSLYKLYIKFFRSKYLSKWTVLLIDLFLIFCSAVISYSIATTVYSNLNVFFPNFWRVTFALLSVNLFCFLIFKTYCGIIRYSTLYEVQRILYSLITSHLLFFLVLYVVVGGISGSLTLAFSIISLSVSTFLMLGTRIFIVYGYKKYLNQIEKQDRSIPIFIYGITPESVSLNQALLMSQGKYTVIGFITQDKSSHSIGKYPIVSISKYDISELKKYSFKTILFPNNEMIQEESQMVDVLVNNKYKILLLPQFKDVSDLNESIFSNIRPIQIEDLLGRKEIKISTTIIDETVRNKKILVTGAAGSIGSEIVRQLALFNPQMVICVDIAETPLNDLDLELKEKYPNLKFHSVIGDVRNSERLEMIFSRYKPDIVFHAAAYKHVPMMENNPCEAILTNVFGTKQVADFSVRYGIEMFVMISTDKAVNPTNIMGTSKRLAEIYVQSLATQEEIKNKKTKFVTTRFGNVLGSNGSVIPLFKKQLEHGGPLTVTHPEITRYFMTIPEACRLVLEASAIGKSGHIYVFDMGQPVKIFDLAKKMIELAGLKLDADIKIKFTGLRPGEKLYEELLNDSETVIPTDHDKILIAKVREYNFTEICEPIEQLIKYSREVDIPKTVLLMKKIVPEFVSKNSDFCKFDAIQESGKDELEKQIATEI